MAEKAKRLRGVRDRLPANVLRKALPDGRHADGAGLYLLVKPDGRKSWVFIFTHEGKRREMGLGPAGDPKPSTESDLVSLRRAREKADEVRALVARGLDPLSERNRAQSEAAEAARATELASAAKEARDVTFGAVADAYVSGGIVAGQRIPGIAAELRNAKHIAQWKMTLGPAYCKTIRKMSISDVSTADVLAVLNPIWLKKPETASRIRGRIERVLDAAETIGLREGKNPALWRGHLANLLPKRQKLSRGHHAALSWEDMPDFITRLREREGIAALGLEFLILTAARSGEVRGMIWEEVDQEAGLWTVPGDRMKAGRAHRVPLPDRAQQILEQVKPLTDGVGLVFPGNKGRPMSDMTLAAVLKRMKATEITVHGFRSSFRDWVFEATGHPGDLAEAALAHVHGTAVERAYRRGDALEKRRGLMEDWARFLEGPSGKNIINLSERTSESASQSRA